MAYEITWNSPLSKEVYSVREIILLILFLPGSGKVTEERILL
jgi:hypothetical protein